MNLKYSLVFLLLVYHVTAFPRGISDGSRSTRVAARDNMSNNKVSQYLLKYGYVAKSKANDESQIANMVNFADAIKSFQKMAGLKVTGIMDELTAEFMSMDRCGVEDQIGAENMNEKSFHVNTKFASKNLQRKRNRRRKSKKQRNKLTPIRSKRYALAGSSWNTKTLTYSIDNYTPDMQKSHVDKDIKKAFQIWANVTKLSFKKWGGKSGKPDFRISFGKGTHDDPYPFDGKGGTLAHAFFPSDGRAHFDDSESFSHVGGSGKINLYTVAAHEFGHALGLSHSSVQDSLMAPFYQGYDPNFKLHEDDILGIQEIYGKHVNTAIERPKKPVTRPPQPPKKTRPTKKPRKNVPDVCDTDFDAFLGIPTSSGRFYTYSFKGSYYYEIDQYGVKGSAKKIGKKWPGLPGNLNAAVYSIRYRKTYFFKGDRMWRYTGTTLDRNFPVDMSTLGFSTPFNAAFVWGANGNIILMRKKKFYILNERMVYDPKYNTRLSEYDNKFFNGVPQDVDAAVRWENRKTYFFKGDAYYRFNDGLVSVDAEYLDASHPQLISERWIGCTGRADASKIKEKPYKTKNKNNKGRKRNKGGRNKSVKPLIPPPQSPNRRDGPKLAKLQAPPPEQH